MSRLRSVGFSTIAAGVALALVFGAGVLAVLDDSALLGTNRVIASKTDYGQLDIQVARRDRASRPCNKWRQWEEDSLNNILGFHVDFKSATPDRVVTRYACIRNVSPEEGVLHFMMPRETFADIELGNCTATEKIAEGGDSNASCRPGAQGEMGDLVFMRVTTICGDQTLVGQTAAVSAFHRPHGAANDRYFFDATAPTIPPGGACMLEFRLETRTDRESRLVAQTDRVQFDVIAGLFEP